MDKILVVYATNAGSTAEIAQAVGEALGQDGGQVDVHAIETAPALDSYDAVVVGGPMILGWHREAQNFIEQHQDALRRVPVAYFMVALSLTEFTEKQYAGTPIYQDARLAKAPKNPDKLSFRENFTSVASYAKPAFERAPQAAPVSIGFFGGKLDYGRLNLFQRLFVRLLIGAAPGDFRNWDAIHEWSEGLLPALSRGA